MLKPYSFRSQCLLSDHFIPSNPVTKKNCSLSNSIVLPNFLSTLPLQHRTRTLQSIVCIRKGNRRWWSQTSNRKILELASIIALNLKILPQPLNLLVGEIARGDWNGVCSEYLNHLGGRGFGGWRRKTKRRRMKSLWFVFMLLICVLGLLSWRISELDLFFRALLFCLLGISLFRLWGGKIAIKELFLGFFIGIVLMSSRFGKDDAKFWVERLRIRSPFGQIVIKNNNRKGRKGGKAL